MRKRFLPDDLGIDKQFWENMWSKSSLQDALHFCEIDPIRNIFNRYLPEPPARILEAGCGLGQNVIFYKKLGYDIEGIDYAEATIRNLNSFYPSLNFKVGNIVELPYPDNYFGAYYSGGVVEHFEDGPSAALKEAHRVLCKDGILIITVPYINLIRRSPDFISTLLLKNRVIRAIDIDGFTTFYCITDNIGKDDLRIPGFHFHEYWYTKSEFSNILEKNGFKIIFSKRLYILWGLSDYKFLRKILKTNKLTKKEKEDHLGNFQEKNNTFLIKFARTKLMKSIFVEENEKNFITYPLLYLLKLLFSHLLIFVCKTMK